MNPHQEYALDRLYSLARELSELAPLLPTAEVPAAMSSLELAFLAMAFAVVEGGAS